MASIPRSGLPGTRDVAASPPSRYHQFRCSRVLAVAVSMASHSLYRHRDPPLESASPFVPTLYVEDRDGRRGRERRGNMHKRDCRHNPAQSDFSACPIFADRQGSPDRHRGIPAVVSSQAARLATALQALARRAVPPDLARPMHRRADRRSVGPGHGRRRGDDRGTWSRTRPFRFALSLAMERRRQAVEVRSQALVERARDQEVGRRRSGRPEPVDEALASGDRGAGRAARGARRRTESRDQAADLVVAVAVPGLASRHGSQAMVAEVEPEPLVDLVEERRIVVVSAGTRRSSVAASCAMARGPRSRPGRRRRSRSPRRRRSAAVTGSERQDVVAPPPDPGARRRRRRATRRR